MEITDPFPAVTSNSAANASKSSYHFPVGLKDWTNITALRVTAYAVIILAGSWYLFGQLATVLRPLLLGGLGLLWLSFTVVLLVIAFTPDAAVDVPADLPPPLRAGLLCFLGDPSFRAVFSCCVGVLLCSSQC